MRTRSTSRIVPTGCVLLAASFLVLAPPCRAAAQTPAANPADVASPEAIVEAVYESIQRAPGERYDWDRFRSLYLPGARLIPNTEQTEGAFRVLTVEDFIAWIDGVTVIGGASDQGFSEEQVAARVERFGDIAHVFSTYQKHFHGSQEILGRGINSIQLVWRDNRWWITHVVWDEESGAGPVPARYLPGGV
jgi:hypothetical protein